MAAVSYHLPQIYLTLSSFDHEAAGLAVIEETTE